MSANNKTVMRYIDGFNKGDHAQILFCLTDDIEWTVFGHLHLVGKDAYDRAIEDPGFTGPPVLRTIRMVMGEIFAMRDAKIAERRAFLIELKENDYR